ncbi:hypothetical protein, partial [Lysinibacillus xylanilyticus]|uniref:hypothetical protein n=1 Tax=Lysinibacillus xylanilyticus TaxID=582475 RepID=UPI003CFF8AB5
APTDKNLKETDRKGAPESKTLSTERSLRATERTPAPTDKNLKETDRKGAPESKTLSTERSLRATERTPAPTDKNLKETDRNRGDGNYGVTEGKQGLIEGKNLDTDG